MENTVECSECNNRFRPLVNKILLFLNRQAKMMPKSEAYNNATYGNCMSREEYIKRKQSEINLMIREKVHNISITDTDFEKYFLLVSLNDTEEECAFDIFKVFADNGYRISKISNQVEILDGTNVYIISWKTKEEPDPDEEFLKIREIAQKYC